MVNAEWAVERAPLKQLPLKQLRACARGFGASQVNGVSSSGSCGLFGAQLNSEIERQTARDTTIEYDKPLGARGAVVADTVGAAIMTARLSQSLSE